MSRFVAVHDPLTVGPTDISVWLQKDGWSANTRVCAHSALRKFFVWLVEVEELRATNPMRHVTRPKPTRGVPRPVPEDIVARLLGNIDDSDTDLMFRLGALQGMRRAEIAGLRFDDVDFSRGVILVRGKGSKVRQVPLHPQVEPLLRERASKGGEFVFPSVRVGLPVSPRTVNRKITEITGGAFTPHQLRHRFASAVYRASGNDLRLVQEVLGHASVATTQIYTAVSSEDMRSAVSGV